jgi:hypothetical protein
MRNHWHPSETLDLHAWVQEASDDACSERIRMRLDYLRWLHRAVAWEHTKERLATAAVAVAICVIPGLGLAMGLNYLYKRYRNTQ